MIAIAHFLAITCYVAAAGLAAAPFARPIPAPVRGVIVLLGVGLLAHLAALCDFLRVHGQLPMVGLGPALSLAAFLVAAMLMLVELLAREVSLTLFAAPFAALATIAANVSGMHPGHSPPAAGSLWLASHVALSFLGFAAFATAAAAGTMYLVERHELKSRRFGAIFRFFPPLETLDKVNHVAVVAAWLALTLGTGLAIAYAAVFQDADVLKVIWGVTAWLAITALTVGRLVAGWQARRAAVLSSVLFLGVVALYLAFRVLGPQPGQFL